MADFTPTGTHPTPTSPQCFLPDFCANRTVFLVIVIAELLSLVLVLSSAHRIQDFWLDLALVSLFIQWIALGAAAALCYSARWINKFNILLATLSAYAITQLVTLLFSLLALWMIGGSAFGFGQNSSELFSFVLRNLTVSSIVSLAALRYFYVQQQWKRNLEAESRARLLALQSRIRPHFLFNSMNTIISLIRTQPEQAEQAVLDLADLFRSSLEQKEKISLAEELEITRRYLRIEALRLGERLQVAWRLDGHLPLTAPIPALILQPLVENAVYHGIQTRPEGGCVTIQIEVRDHTLRVVVSNPLPGTETAERRNGNRIAQANIRERLTLAYGRPDAMNIREIGGQYTVSFTIPLEAGR